jgi:hypothetical protein
MMKSMDASEANQLKTGTLSDFWGDFILPRRPTSEGTDTEGKATGKDGPSRATLQRAGNAPIDTSSSAPAQTPGSGHGKLQEEIRRMQQGTLAHNVPRLDNQVNKNPQWSCLVCTL